MGLFSVRYGYTKPSEVIIREQITREIQNAICSAFDNLTYFFEKEGSLDHELDRANLERYLWTHVLNERDKDFMDMSGRYHIVSTTYIENKDLPWYEKMDLIEVVIDYLKEGSQQMYQNYYWSVLNDFVGRLNADFERLHFAYHIVDNKVVEINTKEEIDSLEQALKESPSNIRKHLSKALELYAKRPEGDYRNSIKESISAVEAYCREKTGARNLGDALKNLEKKGIIIHPVLKTTFEKLYAYTNQPDTGIRHALMEDTDTYTPKAEEAMFMLVSCSAFINYLNRKV
jgi:hypothetical protein